MSKVSQHELAVQLEEALTFVNELRIPVISRDVNLTLKERAKLARQLFKSLGLKGISVRVATGAYCLWVQVFIPAMEHDEQAHRGPRSLETCRACAYDRKTRLKLEEILHRAFPKELDRSDAMTDYFDPSWTFYHGLPQR